MGKRTGMEWNCQEKEGECAPQPYLTNHKGLAGDIKLVAALDAMA